MDRTPILERHLGFSVLRDDLLEGGTKGIIADYIINNNIDKQEFVYASPGCGGFQISLATFCSRYGKKATIFTARNKTKYDNTILAQERGANIVEIYPGYLSTVQKRARDYCYQNDAVYVEFGGNPFVDILVEYVKKVITAYGKEPDEIWIAVGSGTVADAILKATEKCIVYGVQVGKDYEPKCICPHIINKRLHLLRYDKPFKNKSKVVAPFPSMPHYDLKAYEMMIRTRGFYPDGDVLFWNVM